MLGRHIYLKPWVGFVSYITGIYKVLSGELFHFKILEVSFCIVSPELHVVSVQICVYIITFTTGEKKYLLHHCPGIFTFITQVNYFEISPFSFLIICICSSCNFCYNDFAISVITYSGNYSLFMDCMYTDSY